jgi:hypothetical protein
LKVLLWSFEVKLHQFDNDEQSVSDFQDLLPSFRVFDLEVQQNPMQLKIKIVQHMSFVIAFHEEHDQIHGKV